MRTWSGGRKRCCGELEIGRIDHEVGLAIHDHRIPVVHPECCNAVSDDPIRSTSMTGAEVVGSRSDPRSPGLCSTTLSVVEHSRVRDGCRWRVCG